MVTVRPLSQIDEISYRSESGLVTVVIWLLPVDLFFFVGGVLLRPSIGRLPGTAACRSLWWGRGRTLPSGWDHGYKTSHDVPPLCCCWWLLDKQNISTPLVACGSRITRFYMWFSKSRTIRHLLLARGSRFTLFYMVLQKQNLLTPLVADQTFCLWSELLF